MVFYSLSSIKSLSLMVFQSVVFTVTIIFVLSVLFPVTYNYSSLSISECTFTIDLNEVPCYVKTLLLDLPWVNLEYFNLSLILYSLS